MGEAALRLDYDQEIRTDARKSPRVTLDVSVDVTSENNFWTGITSDISEGGLFLATHRVAPIGFVVLLNLTLPEDDEPIVTYAEVRWIRLYTEQSDVPPGLGLKFIGLDSRALAKIRRFVMMGPAPLYFDE
jgi:uncharacterized protein (TIGR02266 family)